MTKAEMVNRILDDMKKRSDTNPKEIDRRFKTYLNRQNNIDLAAIYNNRFNR